jgi:hypothetical protein
MRERNWRKSPGSMLAGAGWGGGWQEGTAFAYGRQRSVRWKEVLGLWRVSGHDVVVKAVAAEVEGYRKRFTLVTSAVAEVEGYRKRFTLVTSAVSSRAFRSPSSC